MTTNPVISQSVFRELQKLDTCTVSNAIERLQVRLRNEGSMTGKAPRCLFPDLPPLLGYAATGRMRSTSAPPRGRAYHENIAWWRFVSSIPEPRVMVVEDADDAPGAGALMGELHAAIGMALHCAGYVTNGSARDLPALKALRFPVFARGPAVSHMYAHIAEFGEQVEIGGLKILPGDLVHGDIHGVHVIPLSIAPEIPDMVSEILREEWELKELCQSPHFSLDELERKLQQLPGDGTEMNLNGHRE